MIPMDHAHAFALFHRVRPGLATRSQRNRMTNAYTCGGTAVGTEYVPESAKVAFAYPLAVIAWSLAAAWWASPHPG